MSRWDNWGQFSNVSTCIDTILDVEININLPYLSCRDGLQRLREDKEVESFLYGIPCQYLSLD